jgi:NADH:ubiquinone oxidoreductase subunit K
MKKVNFLAVHKRLKHLRGAQFLTFLLALNVIQVSVRLLILQELFEGRDSRLHKCDYRTPIYLFVQRGD